MYEFIVGKIIEATPAYCILENNGIGYYINISLNTYSGISQEQEKSKLFIHHVVREDAQLLFGFAGKKERELFRLLISVSGVGANTARMILSSLTPDEIQMAIVEGNVAVLQSVKGIGAKSAQRIIVDLRDKAGKPGDDNILKIESLGKNRNEALSALVTLGFPKNSVEKVLEKICKQNNNLPVEELVKQALKNL
ncbi:MAG: Holliday junction branch migration protein RuvA [Bacteroidales bacterium]|nr:Holliday junction branch migration protein RuvA [Bacteroidales bacterium]